MNTARDELARDIVQHPWLHAHPWLDANEGLYAGVCPECPGRKITGGHNSPSHAEHLADAILAAGYTKPRQVTTVEELDALPNESVILDARKQCREGLTSIEGRNWWRAMGPSKVLPSAQIALPVTVLYSPVVVS